MRFVRSLTVAAVLVSVCTLLLRGAAPDGKVRVWSGTIQLPTSAEDAPNPNPPFDLFSFGRFNYPYPIRDSLTDRRELVSWRTLHLENEYLRVTVLPDIGGHLYSCLDKRSGREMFYANSAIKKALIGYRGAWAAFGIEFNFPVSHNWASMSPVDFATTEDPDGSGSIWVGNKDQVYGGQWRVQLRLQPGRAALDQSTTLYNSSDVRHRYYWWNNAAVQVWDDSHLVYPTELMATHGFTSVEPWPIDRQGRDLSVIRNQTDGPVSLFTYETREGFVGVYHPRTSSGTVHVASPAELPVHKFWSWGYDRDAASWRTALSDDDSAYVELQSGLFRNQETYAMLEPQETVRFSEQWLPVRDLGGITRATADGVLYMERPAPARMRLSLDVTHEVPAARISVRQGSVNLIDRTVSLSPRDVWRQDVDRVGTDPVTFELSDGAGRILLRHTEGVFDRTPASRVPLGARRTEPTATGSADEVVESGLVDELEGRRLGAMAKYREALARFPRSLPLLKAAGRLAVALGWPESGSEAEAASIGWLQAAASRNTTDFETRYYLGVALAAAGRPDEARPHLEAAERFRATRTAASLQLARLSARQGNVDAALEQVRTAVTDSGASLPGALEVALLRRLRRADDARSRARYWQTIDPTSSLLRYERTVLGDPDSALWPHLGTDANRVLDLADQYFAIGAYADAADLLAHDYPSIEPPLREPGAVLPRESPLVAYYRGYARARAGGSAAADYAAASRLPTAYVFPSRRSSYAVLADALRQNPEDATARFLAGSLYLSAGLIDPAIDAWQRARSARAPIPTLHRNLGLALLQRGGGYQDARAVLEEGVSVDRSNVEVYLTLDGVLSAANAAPRARVDALRRFPSAGSMPASMVFKLALALAESGDEAAAERLFHDRYFPREEGGTNVRSVYVQTRLISAALLAASGGCGRAIAILDSFAREDKDLPFTAGGLADALQPPPVARQVAVIDATCGRTAEARAIWTRLDRVLGSGGAPVSVAIADEAHRRLGLARTPDHRRRLEAALDSATRTLDSGGTSNPALLEYARALLLAALDRSAEAQEALRQVFVYPDRGMAHALARGREKL